MRQIVSGALLLAALMLESTAQAGKVTYVHTDIQGTPVMESDAQGHITARFDYTPYGVPVQSLGGSPNGPGYTGHVNDPDTGFVYMQARYYDPVVGRFLSVDPVGPSANDLFHFNRFSYVNNNPIANIDPDGRSPSEDVSICMGNMECISGSSHNETINSSDEAEGASTSTVLSSRQSVGLAQKQVAPTSSSENMNAALQWVDDSAAAPGNTPDPADSDAIETLTILAQEASNNVPMSMPQPMRGTAVHLVFEGFVKALNKIDQKYDSEVTYLNRNVWPIYSAYGSSRADAIYGSRTSPQLIVDIKTGNARMTRRQAAKYQKNLPLGTRIYQIVVPP